MEYIDVRFGIYRCKIWNKKIWNTLIHYLEYIDTLFGIYRYKIWNILIYDLEYIDTWFGIHWYIIWNTLIHYLENILIHYLEYINNKVEIKYLIILVGWNSTLLELYLSSSIVLVIFLNQEYLMMDTGRMISRIRL